MRPTSLEVIADALGGVESTEIGAMSSPDGAVTLLLTAVDDCPAIVARLGDEAAALLLRNHRAVVEGVAEGHDGQVMKVEQDAVMISFTSSHAGLRCAIDLQRTFASLDVAPGATPLRLRAGLHTGFVISSGKEVFGRNVVIAARLAAAAAAGEIFVSSAVKEYTESDPRFRFDGRGAAHFRGVHGEHQIYCVDWAGGEA